MAFNVVVKLKMKVHVIQREECYQDTFLMDNYAEEQLEMIRVSSSYITPL